MGLLRWVNEQKNTLPSIIVAALIHLHLFSKNHYVRIFASFSEQIVVIQYNNWGLFWSLGRTPYRTVLYINSDKSTLGTLIGSFWVSTLSLESLRKYKHTFVIILAESAKSNVTIGYLGVLITDAKSRICFFQHWFVYLSVCDTTQKVDGFWRNFQDNSALMQGTNWLNCRGDSYHYQIKRSCVLFRIYHTAFITHEVTYSSNELPWWMHVFSECFSSC